MATRGSFKYLAEKYKYKYENMMSSREKDRLHIKKENNVKQSSTLQHQKGGIVNGLSNMEINALSLMNRGTYGIF